MLALAAALVHVALPFLCLLVAGRAAERRGLLWVLVAGPALYEVLLLGVGLALGHLGLLAAPVPLVVVGTIAVALGVAGRAGVAPLRERIVRIALAARASASRPGGTLLVSAAFLASLPFVLSTAQDWSVGTTQFDGLAYHVPRALLWEWHGDFSPWRASQWQQVGLPVGGDVALLPGVFLGCGWRGGAWTGMWLALGAAAAVAAAARTFGLGRRAAFLGALAFLSFPAVGLRLGDVNTDIAAAFPLLAAYVLVTRSASAAESLALFPVLAGAALACKANVAPVAALLLVALARPALARSFAGPRAARTAIAGAFVGTALVAASFQPVYALFGDPLGGFEGRGHSSWSEGLRGGALSTAFYALHWAVEPFCAVPEPPRFGLLDRLGLGRAYVGFGAETRARWYPAFDSDTNRTGLLPILALPWLLGAVPRAWRLRVGLTVVLGFLSLQSPVAIQPYASRFTVTLLGLLAVLWAARAATHPRLVPALVIASLLLTSLATARATLPELRNARLSVPEEQRRLIDALAGRPLWVMTGGLSCDAWLAGVGAELRFEYLACPPDGEWRGHLERAAARSPWLLFVHGSESALRPGPNYATRLFPACREMPRGVIEDALRAAGWRSRWSRPGYEVWSAEP